ncbi:MAG: carbohydrate-binding domain-containing protein, partial [Oscillospiraceae bacterium]|nr:carbohydrate-binding domain-containing protein [Oscillospiraceae bacterium]
MKRTISALTALALCLSLAACVSDSAVEGSVKTTADDTSISTTLSLNEPFDAGYTERDLDGSWDAASAVNISFDGDNAQIDGTGAYFENSVLTITKEGVFVLSGVLSYGQVVIEASDTEKVQLVLNGVEISCSNSAAINAVEADKLFITLAEGSDNTLIDGASYALAEGEDEPDACIFAKCDLTINGT